MCTVRQTRSVSTILTFLSATVLSGLTDRPAFAQRGTGDPVEELAAALRVPVRDAVNNPDELKFREQNLKRSVAALRTPGELRRALQLQAAWRDEGDEAAAAVQDMDRKYRAIVANRFRDELRAVMKSGDPLAQIAAADLLDEIGVSIKGSAQDTSGLASGLAPGLGALLDSPHAGVREASARALGKINPRPDVAAPALGKLLRAPQPTAVHLAAATSLGDLIQVVGSIQSQKVTSGVTAEPKDLAATVSNVIPEIEPALTDPNESVRRAALEVIRRAATAVGELVREPSKKPEELPPPGRKWTADERNEVEAYRDLVVNERNMVMPMATALRKLGPALRQSLRDPDRGNRLAATRALEEIGNSHMRLVRLVQSVPVMQPEAASAAGPLPAERRPAEPVVRRMSGGEFRAAKAVGTARLLFALQKPVELTTVDPLEDLIVDELPALSDNLADPDVRVRLATMNVLEMLGASADRASALLIRAMDDPNRFVRWSAVRTLGKTKPIPAAVPGLAKVLNDQDLGVRLAATATAEAYGDAARGALPQLVRDVTHGDAEIREAAVRVIERLGPSVVPTAVPALAEALFDRDVRVRRVAAEALGRFGAAARGAEPALRQALTHEDPEERRAVSEALLSIIQPTPGPGR